MANTLKFGNGEWATKEGSTLAYNDENGNFKPLPFTFDRSTSATRVNKQGLIEVVSNNEPRIDFLNDSKGALLLEPSRTNSFQQSNQFDTTWQISAAGISVTPNQVGVGGSTDAWKLTEGTFSGEHFIRQTPNVGGVVSVSIYAKAGTNDFVYLRGVTSGVNKRTWFNLSNGTVGTSQGISAEMISMGNGWYRCVMVLDHQTAFEYYIATSKADGVSSYQGNNGYIYIQNSQLEQGSYATSYIPTRGSIGTRVAETCEQTPPSGIIGQTEGTMLIDIYIDNNSSDFVNFFLWNGTTANRVFIQRRGNNKFIQCQMSKSGETTVDFSGNTVIGIGRHKMAVSYSNSRLVAYIDGNKIGEENTGFSYTNELTKMGLTENPALRILKEIKLYDNSMTDAELQALTKI